MQYNENDEIKRVSVNKWCEIMTQKSFIPGSQNIDIKLKR